MPIGKWLQYEYVIEYSICPLWRISGRPLAYSEKFEDTKGVIRSRKSKDRQYHGQKKKDKGANNDLKTHYTENKRSSNTNLIKNRGWTQVLR
jgi:hypothetical protein